MSAEPGMAVAYTGRRVLFVCLGNTCRSPIAEAVFIDLVQKAGQLNEWKIDSAAIMPWHTGEPPNQRSCDIFQKYNMLYEHTARQITQQDFFEFDIIFGMDNWNISDLNSLKPPDSQAQIMLLGHFDPEGVLIMHDPYCDDEPSGFETCYQQSLRCCRNFLHNFT